MEQPPPPFTNQTNIVVVGKAKSVGAAFILAFFFGPLGLMYASVIGGLVMFVIGLISFFLLPIIGYVFVHIGCVIWAIVAANNANANLHKQAGGIIQNQSK